jgi:hypothetical protein
MSNKSYAVQRFDTAVSQAVGFRKRLAEALKKAKAFRKQMVHIAKMLCPLENDNASLYFDVDSFTPKICFTMHQLDSFKDNRLATALWFLTSLDGQREVKTSDWAESLNRDYKFEFEGFDVIISAYVKSDSPTCRKVVVGSKTEVVNEYKIVCD